MAHGMNRLVVFWTLLASTLCLFYAQAAGAAGTDADRAGPADPVEIESFMDGFWSREMRPLNIPGAVFILVRDGEILFAKGYGLEASLWHSAGQGLLLGGYPSWAGFCLVRLVLEPPWVQAVADSNKGQGQGEPGGLDDFCAFADVLQWVREQGSVVVMGSQGAIVGVIAARGNWLEVTGVF